MEWIPVTAGTSLTTTEIVLDTSTILEREPEIHKHRRWS